MHNKNGDKFIHTTYDDDGEEIQVAVPGCWEICNNCEGHGKHSRHLGAFTQSEFYETFDDEESRENYFNGFYDTQCEECRGDGKIWTADYDHMTDDECNQHSKYLDDIDYYDAEREAERRFGC